MTRLTILGPPGAGKGTQAEKISEHLGVPHISTGRILRNNKDMETEFGTPREYIDKGEYIPDAMMIQILEKRLAEPDAAEGFILDGFPRNRQQADFLEEKGLDLALYLNVDKDRILNRLTGRRVCKQCGESYHLELDPPTNDNRCDECGGELKQRKDDRQKVVVKRLKTYRTKTAPLKHYYQDRNKLREIDGNPSIAEVWDNVRTALQEELDV